MKGFLLLSVFCYSCLLNSVSFGLSTSWNVVNHLDPAQWSLLTIDKHASDAGLADQLTFDILNLDDRYHYSAEIKPFYLLNEVRCDAAPFFSSVVQALPQDITFATIELQKVQGPLLMTLSVMVETGKIKQSDYKGVCRFDIPLKRLNHEPVKAPEQDDKPVEAQPEDNDQDKPQDQSHSNDISDSSVPNVGETN